MKAFVVAVGDANVDLIAPVESFPGKGGEVSTDKLHKCAGGSAANLCVALARLGQDSRFIGRVGDDPLGHFLIDNFRKEKVDIGQLQIDEKVGTGLQFIAITRDGERTMYGFRGANIYLSVDEINMDCVKSSRVLHISGYALLSDPQRKTTIKILKVARGAGALVSLDVGVLPATRATNRVCSILRSVDILFLGEREASALVGTKKPEKAAKDLLKFGPKIVALKLGRKGCFILTDRERVRSPAFPIKVVDTTGAGDAFDAGFLTGVIRGWSLKRTARFANALGSLSTTKIGAQSALPNRREVKRFLRRFGNAEVA